MPASSICPRRGSDLLGAERCGPQPSRALQCHVASTPRRVDGAVITSCSLVSIVNHTLSLQQAVFLLKYSLLCFSQYFCSGATSFAQPGCLQGTFGFIGMSGTSFFCPSFTVYVCPTEDLDPQLLLHPLDTAFSYTFIGAPLL